MKLIVYRDGYWFVILRSDHGEVTGGGFYFWWTAWIMSLIPGYPDLRSSVGL